MSISQMVLRGHVSELVVAIVVLTIGCHKYTYDPHIQSVDLPPGVTSDPTQFRAQAAMRTPGATHHSSRPGKCPACLVDIEIGPLGDTREVSPTPLALLPGTGRAVAKIVNHDPAQTEEIYGFRPVLQFEYYVWADTAYSMARLTLLEVPAPSQPGLVRATFQKNLQYCTGPGHLPPTSPDADFKFCRDVHLSTGVQATYAGMLGVTPRVSAFLSRMADLVVKKFTVTQPPLWLGCLHGCCG
ncbi:MAG TPA: hypothetical protein VK478_17275 [Gemmatimonadaceae bacterium]|jgi:hypothetical protein|nr:hypothetical protein [Gemmatimonadaceae bacterium]